MKTDAYPNPTAPVPVLSNFVALPEGEANDGQFHLVIYRDRNGKIGLGQWVLGAFPEGFTPLAYLPTPVGQLHLPPGFVRNAQDKLRAWDARHRPFPLPE